MSDGEVTTFPSQPIIVVGGGLAGLSAAHEAYLRGSNVVLIDKQGFLSGNSGKATSGINGSLTRTQVAQDIKDSVDKFYQDTLASAKDRANPELIKVLTYNSAEAVHWLQQVFHLDLSVVSRLGGHSEPRTHRGKDAKFPGMAITYKLLETLENLSIDEPDRVVILKNTQVIDLLISDSDSKHILGVKYKQLKDKVKGELKGPVIMATGGYAADFTKNSLLRKFRNDIFDLPSTNGEHATGDGQKIMMKNHGIGIDLEKVQVHPTGLIDLNATDVINGTTSPRFLFLGAEALRGEGGLMFNSKGERFVNELGTRDYVSGEMQKQAQAGNGPIRLVLTEKAGKNLEFHVKHYHQRNLMKTVTGDELLKELGTDEAKLVNEFKYYNDCAASNKPDKFGKQYFPAAPVEFSKTSKYYVSYVTRVLHFTMGGIKINDKSEVLFKNDQNEIPFQGLYACGEVAGGVHGHNRLGGSSLLACVVFGRVAADQASSYLLQQLSKAGSGAGINEAAASLSRLKQISLHIDPNNDRVIVDWGKGDGSGGSGGSNNPGGLNGSGSPGLGAGAGTGTSGSSGNTAKSSAASAKPPPFAIPDKEFTMEEIAQHNTREDCWCVIKNVVLDVTEFLPSHPGGADTIVNFAGKDATENFDMLHEDNVIKRYAPKCVLGRLKGQTPQLEI